MKSIFKGKIIKREIWSLWNQEEYIKNRNRENERKKPLPPGYKNYFIPKLKEETNLLKWEVFYETNKFPCRIMDDHIEIQNELLRIEERVLNENGDMVYYTSKIIDVLAAESNANEAKKHRVAIKEWRTLEEGEDLIAKEQDGVSIEDQTLKFSEKIRRYFKSN